MSTAALELLNISMNSSLPPAGPRNRNSLITTGEAPLPDSATDADPPPVLTAFSVAVLMPGLVGANVTATVVDEEAGSVADSGALTENCDAPVPVIVSGVVNVIASAVLLVSVTICVAVAGGRIDPNAIDAGAAVSGTTGTVTGTVNVPEPVQPFAPAAWTVNVKLPAAVGLPASAPLAPNSRPAGMVPLPIVNVEGLTPPVAVNVVEYAMPTKPAGGAPLTVIAGHAADPVSATDRVPPLTLVTASVALFGPGVAGWNDTTSGVVSEPPRNDVPGAPTLNEPESGPVIANGGVSVTLLTGSVFAIVSVVGVVEPGATVPKSNDDGVTMMPVMAFPASGTLIVPAAELVTVSIADFCPVVVGWNVTGKVAVAPKASVVAVGVPAMKSPASAPPMTGALSVTAPSSRFLIVTGCDAVSGAASDPKSRFNGDATIRMFCGLRGVVS